MVPKSNHIWHKGEPEVHGVKGIRRTEPATDVSRHASLARGGRQSPNRDSSDSQHSDLQCADKPGQINCQLKDTLGAQKLIVRLDSFFSAFTPSYRITMNGLFISDLHLFSQRSIGQWHWEQHQGLIESAKAIVLGGDIFDVRWSQQGNLDATIAAATDWLNTAVALNPDAKWGTCSATMIAIHAFRTCCSRRALNIQTSTGVRMSGASAAMSFCMAIYWMDNDMSAGLMPIEQCFTKILQRVGLET